MSYAFSNFIIWAGMCVAAVIKLNGAFCGIGGGAGGRGVAIYAACCIPYLFSHFIVSYMAIWMISFSSKASPIAALKNSFSS
jgi:hypothetical protein